MLVETKHTSVNGRWGISIVHAEDVDLSSPVEGRLVALGKIEGHDTFRFEAEEGTGRWFLVSGDAAPLEGAAVVCEHDLQGGGSVTLLVGGDAFAVKKWGYKRRRSEVVFFRNGERINLPASVMLAMGIISGSSEPEEVKIEVPALSGTMAAALKAAGLA